MTKLERCYLIWRRGFYEHDWRTNQEIRKDDHFPIILLPSFLFPSLFFSSKCQKSCFNAVWMEQGTSFVSFYKKMNGSIFVSGFLSCFLWVEYKNQNTIFFLFSFSFFFLRHARQTDSNLQLHSFVMVEGNSWVVYMGREKGQSEGEENPAKDSLI